MKVYIQFPRTSEFDNAIANKLSPLEKDNQFYYFISPLQDVDDINEHLVWLFNWLDRYRKFIKSMTNSGVQVTCVCKLSKKSKNVPIDLKPQALALAHLLGIGITII